MMAKPTYEQLEEFVRDLAGFGLRVDRKPTMRSYDISAGQMYLNLTDYLDKADQQLRNRAKRVLEGKTP